MSKVKIKQVDAFTSIPFGGNPAGVVTDANGLSDETKLKIAKEMNCSETAFVSKSEVADFKVQFFTPKFEIDLCGHATIATFSSLYEENKIDSSKHLVYQETKAGILPIEIRTVDNKTIFTMTQVNPQFRKLENLRGSIAKLLGISEDDMLETPLINISTGIWWLVFGVKNLKILENITPDLDGISKLSEENGFLGISLFTLDTFEDNCDYHIRSIAPYGGIIEDPVCGTGNGSVSSYIVHNNLINSKNKIYLVGEQGHFVNRPGKTYVEITKDNSEIVEIKVGGEATTVLSGEIIY